MHIWQMLRQCDNSDDVTFSNEYESYDRDLNNITSACRSKNHVRFCNYEEHDRKKSKVTLICE